MRSTSIRERRSLLKQLPLLHKWRVMLALFIALSASLTVATQESRAQSVSIDQITGPTSPVPSGEVFTIYIGYSWSGLMDEIELQVPIPSQLEYVAAVVAPPNSGGPLAGGGGLYKITNDLSQPSGVGQVELHVRFKYDSTCNGTIASIVRPKSRFRIANTWSNIRFHSASFEVTASAQNRWTVRKDALWCRYDDSVTNSVLYRISVMNNEGNMFAREGCLAMDVVSLRDQLPTGATLQSVVAAPPGFPTPSWTSSTPGPGGSGTITFNPGPTRLNTINQWYYVYYWVQYTKPPFVNSQVVVNNTTLLLRNIRCDIPEVKVSDTASMQLCDFISTGTMSKQFTMAVGYPSNPYYLPSIAPGCCGAYIINYKNTGTVNQTNLVMIDPLPTSIDANSVRTNIPVAGMSVIVEYLIGTVPTLIGTYSTPGNHNTTATIPSTATSIRWTYSGTALPIGTTLKNEIAFCFRYTDRATGAVLGPGSPAIVNNASVVQDGITRATTTNTLQWSANAPKVIAQKFLLDNCVPGPYWPGSTVRFRIAVANLGNINANNCSITDALPAGLTLVPGSTRYQWVNDINTPWITKFAPACGTGSPTGLAQTGLITQSSSTAAGVETVLWSFPTLPKDCDGNPSYLVIDFEVKVATDPAALAGQYCNNYTFRASSYNDVLSNNACFIVSASPQGNASKTVGTLINGTFSPSASIPAGGQGYFKLRFKNTGNSPLRNLNILDIMPHTGATDVTVLPPFTPRGNDFALTLTAAATISTTATGTFTDTYDASPNPKRSLIGSGFGVVTDFGPPVGTLPGSFNTFALGKNTLQIDANTILLQPGQYVEALVPFKVADDAMGDSVTCNSFAYQTRPAGYGVGSNPVLLRAESPTACVTAIAKETGGGCCDTAYFVPFDIPHVQVKYKTVHVVNLQGSAITSIDIEYRDCSAGGPGTLITDINLPPAGGDYKEIRTPGSPLNRSLPLAFLPTYRRIPATGNLPNWPGGANKQSEVMFNIGFNPYHPSTPDVVCIKLIIHHADGGICEWELPAWDPSTATPTGGGVVVGPNRQNVWMTTLELSNSKLPKPISFVTITVEDTADKIVGGSGKPLVASLDPDTNPTTWGFEQSDKTAIFAINGGDGALDPISVFVASSVKERRPVFKVRTFDADANQMGEDSIAATSMISKVDPPGPAEKGAINVTSIVPNPGSTIMAVAYDIEIGDETRIELFDALGKSVAVLSEGYVGRGSHEVLVNVGALAEGSYFIRITNSISQASAMLRVLR